MNFEKYHKIKILGDEDNKDLLSNPEDEIIIEEKVDGGNFRFMWDKEQGWIMGSRSLVLDKDNKNTDFFKRCIEHVKAVLKDKKPKENLIFYGECMVHHSMHYDWEKIPPYLGFDIKKLTEGTSEYIDYNSKVKMFTELGLDVVPLVKKCKAKDVKKLTDESIPVSAYPSPSAKDKDKQAEGIVLKNYRTQQMAKYVREKFKEVNREMFGKSKKFARQEGDEELIVATYCTNARIEKIIFKLIEEGVKLEMKMMEVMPKRVLADIYEEHWREICFSNWSVNFRGIRKKMTSRCLKVLQQMIVNSGLK